MNLSQSTMNGTSRGISPFLVGIIAAVITLVSVFAQARLYQQKLAEAEMQKAEAQKAVAAAMPNPVFLRRPSSEKLASIG